MNKKMIITFSIIILAIGFFIMLAIYSDNQILEQKIREKDSILPTQSIQKQARFSGNLQSVGNNLIYLNGDDNVNITIISIRDDGVPFDITPYIEYQYQNTSQGFKWAVNMSLPTHGAAANNLDRIVRIVFIANSSIPLEQTTTGFRYQDGTESQGKITLRKYVEFDYSDILGVFPTAILTPTTQGNGAIIDFDLNGRVLQRGENIYLDPTIWGMSEMDYNYRTNVTIKLELDMGNGYETVGDGVFFEDDGNKVKFGYNNTFDIPPTTGDIVQAKYIITADEPLEMHGWTIYLPYKDELNVSGGNVKVKMPFREMINFGQECRAEYEYDEEGNVTSTIKEPNCTFNQIDSYTVELTFNSIYNTTESTLFIDPTIPYSLNNTIATEWTSTDSSDIVTVATIDSSELTAGNKYFLYAHAGVGASGVHNCGIWINQTDSVLEYFNVEPVGQGDGVMKTEIFSTVYTVPSPAQDINIQFSNDGAATTCFSKHNQLLMIDISELYEGVDYFFAENDTEYDLVTVSDGNPTSLTLTTANGEDDWVVFGYLNAISDESSYQNYFYVANDNGETITENWENEASDEEHGRVLVLPMDSPPKNTVVELNITSTGANDHQYSNLFAINLENFENHYIYLNSTWTPTYPAGNNETFQKFTYTPVTTGEQVIFMNGVFQVTSATSRFTDDLRLDGTKIPTGWDWNTGSAIGLSNNDAYDKVGHVLMAVESIENSGQELEYNSSILFRSMVLYGSSATVFSVKSNPYKNIYTYEDVNLKNVTINAYPSAHITPSGNILAYYPFETNNTNTLQFDYGRLSANLSVIGSTSKWIEDGVYRGGYDFDGTDNNYLSYTLNDEFNYSVDGYTVNVWVKSGTLGSEYGGLWSIDSGATASAMELTLAYANKYFYLDIDGAGVVQCLTNTGGSEATGVWQMMTIRRNQSDCRMYINGQLHGQDSTPGDYSTLKRGTTLKLGNSGDTGEDEIFNGSIDEFTWYNYSMTDAEISALFNNQSDRFYGIATLEFTNITFLSGDNRINVTYNLTADLGSTMQLRIREVNTGENTTWQDLTNGNMQTNVFNISSTANDIIAEFNFSKDSNGFHTPILKDTLTFTTWNETVVAGGTPDTTAPKTWLKFPENGTQINDTTIWLSANFTDDYQLKNTTLYFWNESGSLNITNFTEINGTWNSTNLSISVTVNGTYFWNFLTYDNSSNGAMNNTNFTIIIGDDILVDNTPPYFTNIPNGKTQSYLTALEDDFNATDETLFDSFAVNDSRFSINATGVIINATTLGVDNYLLNITINDSSNNLNSTIWSYNVTQATGDLEVYLDGTTANITVELGSVVTYNISRLSGEIDFTGFEDGSQVSGGTFSSNTTTASTLSSINITGILPNSQNYTGENVERWIDVEDTTAPNVTNPTEFPSDPATYAGVAGAYDFNVTVWDYGGINTVWFEFDGDNFTASNVTDNFNVTILGKNAGTYNYTWYANDTSGNLNNSVNGTYTISKAVGDVEVYTNNTADNLTIEAGEDYNWSIAVLAGESTAAAYKDGVLIGSFLTYTNYTNANTLGDINITAILSESTNYQRDTQTRWVHVRDTIPPYFIHIPDGKEQPYLVGLEDDFNATDNFAGDSFAVNDTRFAIDGAGVITNATTLGVANYLINITINDTSNNLNSTIWSFNVTQLASEVNLTLNGTEGNISINQYEMIDLNGTLITGEGIIELYNDGTLINTGSSPIGNYTNFTTGGLKNITLIYPSTQNYSQSSETYYVNVTTLLVDTTPPYFVNIPTMLEDTYLTALEEQFNASDETGFGTFVVNDSRFDINVTGILINATTLGVDNYLINITINDTNNNLNSTIWSYNVTQATGDINLLINGSADNQTAVYLTQTNASATSGTGQTVSLLRDGTDVTGENHQFQTLGVAYYNYTANAANNQNYSAATITRWVNITQASGLVYTYIDGSRANKAQTNNTFNNNLTGELITGLGNINLYVNNVLWNTGTSPIFNITNFTAGTYAINTTYTGNQNYTYDDEVWTLTVTNATAPGNATQVVTTTPQCKYKKLGYWNPRLPWFREVNCI